jgi:Protein of unknown function (DUF2795)
VSEQETGKVGPREDDALKRELRGELQANRATRSEEWREPDPPGEDEPDATWAPAGRFGEPQADEEWDQIELRSDLARHLDRHTWPATREHLIETLESHQAEQRLLDLVSSVPARATFANFHELLTALGLPIEHRPG